MRIAARRRADWLLSPYAHEGRQRQARVSGEWIDVVEWGEGDPIVLVPGLAGGWKLLAPLAARLARHHHVIVPGLRGDRFPGGAPAAQDLGDLARDLGMLLDQIGLERPTVFGVSLAVPSPWNWPSRSRAGSGPWSFMVLRLSSARAWGRKSHAGFWNAFPCRATTAS